MRHVAAVLVIGPADPTSAAGVSADVLSLACLGAYPLAVVAEMCLRDTAHFEGRVALDVELVVEQARLILEDVPVAAIKLVLPDSVELVAALAELVSDYGEVPLIVEAPALALHEDDSEDSALAAAIELLLPQAAVLVADISVARRLVAAGFEGDETGLSVEELAATLCGAGAGHVLLLGGPAAVQVMHLLHGPEGVVRRDVFERSPLPVLGLSSSVSSALAAAMAQGQAVPEAVQAALRFGHAAEGRHFRLGMGTAVPDRRAAS